VAPASPDFSTVFGVPVEVGAVVREFRSCELSTFARDGTPVTWPTMPFFEPDRQRFLITSSVGLAQKALNIRRDGRVAMLFSDPTGSGLVRPPAVLIQGDAESPEELAQFDDPERLTDAIVAELVQGKRHADVLSNAQATLLELKLTQEEAVSEFHSVLEALKAREPEEERILRGKVLRGVASTEEQKLSIRVLGERCAEAPFSTHANAEECAHDQEKCVVRREAAEQLDDGKIDDVDHQRNAPAVAVRQQTEQERAERAYRKRCGDRKDDALFGDAELMSQRIVEKNYDEEIESVESPAKKAGEDGVARAGAFAGVRGLTPLRWNYFVGLGHC